MSDRQSVTDVPEDVEPVGPSSDGDPLAAAPADETGSPSPSDGADERDEGSVRRPLIRATLKHPEGTPPPQREAPVFTMHQQERGGGRGPNRNGRFGGDGGHPNKGARDRNGQNASGKGNSSGGRKRSSRPDRDGQARSGNRRSSSRRNKGRSR